MNALALHLTLAPIDAVAAAAHADLPPGSARLGAERVGPTGLWRRLATLLGEPWQPGLPGERVAVADQLLDAADDGRRWFSASRRSDRFGVARWLVQRVDALRAAGWDGTARGGGERLETLAAVDAGLPPGPAHLGHRVLERLRGPPARRLGVALRVDVEGSAGLHDGLTRQLLDALAAAGATVAAQHPAPPAGDTDLARLKRALTSGRREALRGDGTVRVLVADTPWEAAAAACAGVRHEGVDPAWVVTAEGSALERARRLAGLPGLGHAEGSPHRPALQVLPLALELQLGPQDPDVARQLLTLPLRPVRARVARRLARALVERPGLGNEVWEAALERGLAELLADGADAATCADQRRRVALLCPSLAHSPAAGEVTVARAAAVAAEVADWAEGRARVDAARGGELHLAGAVARDLLAVLRRLPHTARLKRLQLRQLFELVAAPGAPAGVAEAGAPPSAADPAGLPSGCPVVLWWGTLAGAAEDGAAPRWTEAERAALAAAGALLPADGADRLAEHHRWQLPVLGCRERFVAVWWRSSGVEPAEPHPLFDAWGAAVGADSVARCTVEARSLRAADGPVPTVAVPPRPPRAPQWLWELPAGTVPLTRTLSATAIEAMLECPLRWTFEYAAGLRPGAAAEGADERAMIGDLAHRLLQGEVLYPSDTSFDALSPEQAEARVAAAFDARVATEAAPLLLPGQRVTLARARRQIVAAAPALVRALRAGGWRPVLHAEAEFHGVFAGQPTAGRADLVVQREDGVRAVIDLKLTGRRPDAKLRSGEALQLALYAQGFGQQGGLARGAYFAIEAGQLLATDPVDFPEPASHVTGPDLGETLLAGERAWQWWTGHVAAGRVVANGRVERPGEGVARLVEQTGADDFDGPWRRAGPYCAGCSQRRLCGLTIGGQPAAAAEEEG